MGVVTVPESKQSLPGKRSFRPSSSIRHTSQWPVSDVSSDLTVEIGSSSFALHKFPMLSRSGRIRKLLLESKDSKNIPRLNLSANPGGPESFELAAKFCYGINIEFSLSNIAALRSAAHYLEMTEELSEKNLEAKSESYFKEMVLTSIPNSISVLHTCERLLPVSEEINLVNRLITAIANNACKEQLVSGLQKLDQKFAPVGKSDAEKPSDWWGRSLANLKLEFFQRVLSAMKSKGLNQETISEILMNYARNSLQIIRDPQLVNKNGVTDSETQKKQRAILETIVTLLPTQATNSSIPISFLSCLLKTAIASSASTPCRSDLERRIGHQLDQAILEDVLIPAANNNSHSHNSTMYDTDSVQRIFSVFLNLDDGGGYEDDGDNLMDENEMGLYDFENPESPKQSSILKVSKLMDSYLTEVALDSNLMPSKFIALAEMLPDHARIVSDVLYRAVDIFLKVHPNIKDSERYRLCKTVSCQKLSQEACSHAAQNERLPVQIAVQVLYYEQTRLKNAMICGSASQSSQFFFSAVGQLGNRSGSAAGSGAMSPRDNYASVRRENRELKLEVARMRMRLTELEKDHVSMKQEFVKPNRTAAGGKRLFRSLTRKLSKLNAIIFRVGSVGMKVNKHLEEDRTYSDSRFVFQKRRCHSVS